MEAILALEGSLAVLNNQIKHFLFASQLKWVSEQNSVQMCCAPLKSQLLFKRKGQNRNPTNTEMLVTPQKKMAFPKSVKFMIEMLH